MPAVMHAVIFLCCFVFNSVVKTTPAPTYLFLVNVSCTTECKLTATFCCCELLIKIGKFFLDQASVNWKCVTIVPGILGIFLSPTNSRLHVPIKICSSQTWVSSCFCSALSQFYAIKFIEGWKCNLFFNPAVQKIL